jgi:hypothetical protein
MATSFDEEQLAYVNNGLSQLQKELATMNIRMMRSVCDAAYFFKNETELVAKTEALFKLSQEIETFVLKLNSEYGYIMWLCI